MEAGFTKSSLKAFTGTCVALALAVGVVPYGLASANASPANSPANPATKSAVNPPAARKSELDQAYAAVREREWKKAVKAFQAAKVEKPLDYRGLFAMAWAYRQLEECSKAIPPLAEIQQRANRKKLKPHEARIVRNGLFLLARCYAKEQDAGRALYILNGYLLDPRKYASELRQSLSMIDFGGIRTQSDFADYEKAARKALAKVGAGAERSSSSGFDGGGGAPGWNEAPATYSPAPATGF